MVSKQFAEGERKRERERVREVRNVKFFVHLLIVICKSNPKFGSFPSEHRQTTSL